ncbi:MAG: alpha/beta hydrolase [Candidatus Dormiibacterota bacterium]
MAGQLAIGLKHEPPTPPIGEMVGDYSGIDWTQEDPVSPLIPRPIQVLEQVDVPTMVGVGELDVPCFLTMADVLATRIPGACTTTVPDAGHMVNMEKPNVVNALLREAITEAS